MMAMLDFTYVSQATRLNLSCARQASSTRQKWVSDFVRVAFADGLGRKDVTVLMNNF